MTKGCKGALRPVEANSSFDDARCSPFFNQLRQREKWDPVIDQLLTNLVCQSPHFRVGSVGVLFIAGRAARGEEVSTSTFMK